MKLSTHFAPPHQNATLRAHTDTERSNKLAHQHTNHQRDTHTTHTTPSNSTTNLSPPPYHPPRHLHRAPLSSPSPRPRPHAHPSPPFPPSLSSSELLPPHTRPDAHAHAHPHHTAHAHTRTRTHIRLTIIEVSQWSAEGGSLLHRYWNWPHILQKKRDSHVKRSRSTASNLEAFTLESPPDSSGMVLHLSSTAVYLSNSSLLDAQQRPRMRRCFVFLLDCVDRMFV